MLATHEPVCAAARPDHSGRVRHQAWFEYCLFIQTWIPPNTRLPLVRFQIARSGAFYLHFRIRPRVQDLTNMHPKRPGKARPAPTGSHLYPSGGLGEGRLVGSRPGAAEVAAPGLAPLRQIGGFICLVSLTLAALMHMLLRTYDRTIWRAFWFGNPEQHPPRSILRRRD